MKLKSWIVQGLTYIAVVAFFLTAAWWGGRAVSAISQEIPVERKHTIIIDAGHGGEDGGAVSCTGIRESEINLQIARRLNDLLHLLGYQTKMIRTADISVYTAGQNLAQKKVSDLKERVRIINETENAILLSIHQNTFSDPKYSGAQVFYGATGAGKGLAEMLQQVFCGTLNPGSQRECKEASGIYLMEHIPCTGVLVECGFLSNPREEAMLRSAEYQQKLSVVIGSAVSNFLDGQTND